METKH
jgi:signal transduction histidine kinase